MLSVRSIQSKLATSMISMDPTSKSPKLRTYIDHPFQEDISDDLTAIYQGSERVKLKVLRKSVKTEIKFDRDQLIMLKSLRNLNQDNLCAFFGVCTDHDKVVAFVWKSEDRGSLEDLIFSHDINLDSVFKTSLTVDVLKLFHAVEFLHRSPIEYHGQLSACSCMVSSRWVVKLQNFGEHRLTQYMTDKKQLQGSKTPEPKSFFHMAPEILTHVVANEQPNLSVELLQSADEMWDADARARPTAARARSRFSSQMKKYMTSMMDHMITMMEKYTNNLEILVKERTIQVEEEHRRSEELLCQLLPPSIAQDLKKGVAIVPENYESATIFFSDVVGFTTTCSTSTPFQVVTMINSLFSLIDDVISKYDVYKVETIGDCYLIASGLPIRNGDKHVVEIGTMACAMRLAIGSYVVPHLPEKKLQMRFGIHTGHVAAGVVGSMMPRYCLFGDTVNVASRMESNGEPMKIHISEQTKNFIQKYEYPIFRLTYRGEIQIKGKGLQRTYWLDSLLD